MLNRKLYALILGVSSGFGKACALELAKMGYNIYGVHLDMGSNKQKAEDFRLVLEKLGVKATFFNVNDFVPLLNTNRGTSVIIPVVLL